jgi:chromosome segregation ATPase
MNPDQSTTTTNTNPPPAMAARHALDGFLADLDSLRKSVQSADSNTERAYGEADDAMENAKQAARDAEEARNYASDAQGSIEVISDRLTTLEEHAAALRAAITGTAGAQVIAGTLDLLAEAVAVADVATVKAVSMFPTGSPVRDEANTRREQWAQALEAIGAVVVEEEAE